MHLYEKPNGSWVAVVQHKGQRRKITRPTRSEAAMEASRALVELGGAPTADPTVAEALEAWIADSTASPAYIADARRIRERLPRPFIERRLSEVGPIVVRQLLSTLTRDGLTVHRVRRAHTILSAVFSMAQSWEWVDRNPFHVVSAPPEPERAESLPDRDQVAAMLADTADRLWLLVNTAATTSARRGELCALRWEYVGSDSITIGPALRWRPGGVELGAGKSGKKGYRVVAIDPGLADALGAHHDRQRAQAAKEGLGEPVWVFSHRAGEEPWRPDWVSKQWDRLRRKHGLPDTIRLHDLRHYIISEQLAAGVAPKVAGGRAGHTQTRTTTDRYGHRIPAADRDAADTVARILGR